MEPVRTLMRGASRLPPLDGGIPAPSALLRTRDGALGSRVAGALGRRLHADAVWLLASGREALRVALRSLAAQTGRHEVVLPAYTCWSVAAAAVAAGMRVRLVDVDARGRIDLAHLATLPLERAAAVVVTNLFGCAEPVRAVQDLAAPHGACVVDDAAQSLGAVGADGAVGARGGCAVLSFGRGKPLQALGGGALLWRDGAATPRACDGDAPARPQPWRAFALARLWNAALSPRAFALLAATPGLGVGETRFDPGFRRGPISGTSLALCAHALERLDLRTRRRASIAERLASDLRARTRFVPLLAASGETGAYPRLAVRAPRRDHRERALRALAGCGASRLYPAPLDAIPELAPSLVGCVGAPGARALAECVLTLPTHGLLGERRWRDALAALERIAPNEGDSRCAAS